MSLFVAKTLANGVTLYRSRRTGLQYHVREEHDEYLGHIFEGYALGVVLLSTRRSELMRMIEFADKTTEPQIRIAGG
jgi:hypothetical protein